MSGGNGGAHTLMHLVEPVRPLYYISLAPTHTSALGVCHNAPFLPNNPL